MASDCALTSAWAGAYFFRARPLVKRSLVPIENRAGMIADAQVREMALDSLTHKRFHCEGGAVLVASSSLLVRFVAAYQTLCDFLDTVTDRGPKVEVPVIRALHQALLDAVNPGGSTADYWRDHPLDDGGYAAWLVNESRRCLQPVAGWQRVRTHVHWLAKRYVELQTLKHAPAVDQRAQNLEKWYGHYRNPAWDLNWWEFAAASGSTLGIFILVREALQSRPDTVRLTSLFDCYFPWVGGLHILLDYFIDQEEDDAGGDFNFIRCYPDQTMAVAGIRRLYQQVLTASKALQDGAFHRYVARGLLGFYLADHKVRGPLVTPARQLLAEGGTISRGLLLLSRVGRTP